MALVFLFRVVTEFPETDADVTVEALAAVQDAPMAAMIEKASASQILCPHRGSRGPVVERVQSVAVLDVLFVDGPLTLMPCSNIGVESVRQSPCIHNYLVLQLPGSVFVWSIMQENIMRKRR